MSGKISDEQSLLMLEYVLLIFGGIATILISILVGLYLSYLDSPQKDFSIMFGHDLSFNNDARSTWLIKNQEGNFEKMLLAYRTGSSSVPDVIKSSDLVDGSGKSIDSNNIRFNGLPKYSSNFVAGLNSIKITLTDHSLPLGSFEGRILVSGGIPESIPTTITTRPLLTESILLVVIGALISVCIWEVIRNAKNKARNADTEELINYERTNRRSIAPEVANSIMVQIAVNEVEQKRELVRNLSPKITFRKIAVAELIAALLGVAVALFGILYNENITGVRVLDAYQILILLGIGLGAGSLKELVDKY